ncbi:MAG: radical SAM protein [Anaerolineae bacterium]|nr:radical SAM protein [Anaerolineae bacterium]
MTAVKEIQAKVLLSHVRQPDTWFGLKYSMNLYRGCQHRCIYCDSRSECYQIEDFDGEVLLKANAIDLLREELARKRVKGTIGLGSMNDCYMPLEREINLAGRALELIAQFGFTVHVMTKSDLVLRDLDTLAAINECYATVSFTITTADDELGKKLEPGAPLVSDRFRAMRIIADKGIQTGVSLMPVLPFIEDTEENIAAIVRKTHEHGGSYIIPSFGMTMRDRQRAYYYDRLDELFPGLRQKYKRVFGDRYHCPANNADGLAKAFYELCGRYGISPRIVPYEPQAARQLSLFEGG